MSGIVFESYTAPTRAVGQIPRLRGRASSTSTDHAAVGYIPLLAGSAAGVVAYPATASGKVPLLRGVASAAGGTRAIGLIPEFTGQARGTIGFDPGANMAFGGIPLLASSANGIVFYPGSQTDGGVPLLRGAAYENGRAHARGFIPALQGIARQTPTFQSFFLMVQSPGVMQIEATGTPMFALDDAVAIRDTLTCEIVYGLSERVGIADAPHALLDALVALEEHATFADVAGIAWQVLMAETIGMAGSQTAWRTVLAEIADALALSAGVRSTLDATVALAAAMAFGDSLANVVQADIAESMTLGDAQKATLAATVKMLDGLRLTDSLPTPSVTLTALVEETLALGSNLTVQQELAILLRDGVQFLTQLALDDGVYLAWVMNAETHAFTSYSNYPFNSFATIRGKTYGAKADGIYLLEGDTDAGAAIDAFARGGLTDLGSSKLKRMPSAYLGMTTSGRMVMKVTVVDDEGVRQEHWYALEDRPAGALRMGRVKLGRGLKSTYWGFELANVDGADFALDEISWYPLVLDRRL